MLPGGNLLFGGTTAGGTSAQNNIVFHGGTAPSTSPADVVQLYATDVAGAGTFGLHIRDEGGNVFKIGNGKILIPRSDTSGLILFGNSDNPTTGMRFPAGADRIVFDLSGAAQITIASSIMYLTSGFSIDFTGGAGPTLIADAANILAQRNAANAQTFRGYGTFTDASNYERWALSATIGTGITLAAETGGTGGDNLNVTVNPAGTGRVVFGAGNGVTWTTGTKPACVAGIRGTVYYVAGATTVLDTFEVCRKDAADVYAWITLF